MLQVPFFIPRYLLLKQIPFSTHQQAIHGTVLFTPDLLTPHKLFQDFPRLHQYSETFLRTFSTHVHTQSLPRPRDATSINENLTLTERRVRHLERKVLGRYLLSCHTVSDGGDGGDDDDDDDDDNDDGGDEEKKKKKMMMIYWWMCQCYFVVSS